jgi:hypothetical protein
MDPALSVTLSKVLMFRSPALNLPLILALALTLTLTLTLNLPLILALTLTLTLNRHLLRIWMFCS